MSSSKKKKILLQLSSMQLKNIDISKKFTYRDIMRITKHINKSIFGKQCTLWDGFVANIRENKSPYINFYFRGKKLALHRLLYINYVEDLKPNEFIKYSCKNKGRCCCLNHMIKYVKENGEEEDIENIKIENDEIKNDEIKDEEEVYNNNELDEINEIDEDIYSNENIMENTNKEDKNISKKEKKKKDNKIINKFSKFTISFD